MGAWDIFVWMEFEMSLSQIIFLIAYLVSIPGRFFAIMVLNRIGNGAKIELIPGLLVSLIPFVNGLFCVVWTFVFVELCKTGGKFETNNGVFMIPGFDWISKANKKFMGE